MSKVYLKVQGVPGNSTDAAHPGWIELFKLEVMPNWASKPSAGMGTAWVRPIHVYCWSVLGPHAGELHMAKDTGKDYASAVLEIMKPNSNLVKQRIRMTKVHVMSYLLNRDPGYQKPITQFTLVPASYHYERGSALVQTLIHENLHSGQ